MIELRNGSGLAIAILPNGALSSIRHEEVLINQVLGSPVEGGIGNVYLRRRARSTVSAVPLLGPGSPSSWQANSDCATWVGSTDGLDYACSLQLAPDRPTWFWTLRVTNTASHRASVDAVLAQDLGLAHDATVRSSELYTSQYIDHTVLEDDELGFVLGSRQGLPQGDAFPWLLQGCLDGAAGYLTDGFQLYGLDYRATGVPVALGRRRLPNRVYQYEVALPTLQSRPLELAPGASGEITFFAAFDPHHPEATEDADLRDARAAVAAYRALRGVPDVAGPGRPAARGLFDAPVLFGSRDLEPAELERAFGSDWRHVEERDGTLLSFFHGERQHVVTRAKELAVERPTGHVLRSGRDLLPGDDLLSVTAWMFGVFGSQLTIGNTSFNKLLSVSRNPLNVLKSSGQRIFVRTDRDWELLGVPSAFEMGPNSARWLYRGERHTIDIRLETSLDDPVSLLRLEVVRGGPVELLITHDIVLGENEHGPAGTIHVDAAAGRVRLRPAVETLVAQRYPETTFHIVAGEPESIDAIGGGKLLTGDGSDPGGQFVVIRSRPVKHFSLAISGSILDSGRAETLATGGAGGAARRSRSPDTDAAHDEAAGAFWSAMGHGAHLAGGTGRVAEGISRLNDVVQWYLHDALIHCTVPHGLEQYSGAAWGLRDVCQGPVELFIALGHPERVRDILRTVYEHQDRATGDWPQWFMFDRYREMRASDSHADIIHWPIKALCDYVEATGDFSLLDEPVPWTDAATKAPTPETDPISVHVERQVDRIERDVIPGTALPVFAGGDWEDTLQPADPEMAQRLVSTWTVELAYQTLNRYRVVCERTGRVQMANRLAALCDRIRADFNRHLVPDGIVAGLAHFGEDGVEYFLHPRDRATGVSYRLLPMSRGMISGIFTPEQAERHRALIERHLSFPDGVRLMNRPMEYRGGPSRFFKRAESAANFGREVGLQYVHAHIRYIEAMARIGRPDEAFRGLLAVAPIGIEHEVPSALPRQSNAYFSSSDAAFSDRYEAGRRFGAIRSGRVGVKGGWRVYSSGPGIYLNQLVSNVLGVRRLFGDVVLDPVLPRAANGLTFDLDFEGRRVRYEYRIEGAGYAPSGVSVNGRAMAAEQLENPYRPGGVRIPAEAFRAALDRDENRVRIVI